MKRFSHCIFFPLLLFGSRRTAHSQIEAASTLVVMRCASVRSTLFIQRVAMQGALGGWRDDGTDHKRFGFEFESVWLMRTDNNLRFVIPIKHGAGADGEASLPFLFNVYNLFPCTAGNPAPAFNDLKLHLGLSTF